MSRVKEVKEWSRETERERRASILIFAEDTWWTFWCIYRICPPSIKSCIISTPFHPTQPVSNDTSRYTIDPRVCCSPCRREILQWKTPSWRVKSVKMGGKEIDTDRLSRLGDTLHSIWKSRLRPIERILELPQITNHQNFKSIVKVFSSTPRKKVLFKLRKSFFNFIS